jgi:hypothetical protein
MVRSRLIRSKIEVDMEALTYMLLGLLGLLGLVVWRFFAKKHGKKPSDESHD